MSSVTNIIILSLGADEQLPEINRWLGEHEHNDIKEVDVCKHVGGEKCMSPHILMAGFNYFNNGEFVKFLKSLDWRNEAQLLVQTEHEEGYKLIKLNKPPPPERCDGSCGRKLSDCSGYYRSKNGVFCLDCKPFWPGRMYDK